MASAKFQTAVIQSQSRSQTQSTRAGQLPLVVSHTVPVPGLPSANHVLVRVLAVALNPIDHKMIAHFPSPNAMVGCDFCGIVVGGAEGPGGVAAFSPGTRVCGSVFPYAASKELCSGAFSEWAVADARLLLRVPDRLDDLQGAAVGGVGWGTAALAISDPNALALQGRPSAPTVKKEPVLVYGGATATGTMACQMLRLSGYLPIAVTSEASSPLAMQYGAVGTAAYTSPNCVQAVRELAAGLPIRHALDCITSIDSSAACFAAMGRTGGRYACLEGLDEALRTRRAVRVREVMGFEALGVDIDMGPAGSTYSRKANQNLLDLGACWAGEMQQLLDEGSIRPHPILEVKGSWAGIIDGLGMLQRNEVRGHKLVVRLQDI